MPGGLGAASLITYAKQSYGVEFTIEQARGFRKRLIYEVYPELAHYLKDRQCMDMARNLHTTVATVQQTFPAHEQIKSATEVVLGGDTSFEDNYPPAFVSVVWEKLRQCNNNPRLVSELNAEQPHSLLMRRIFYGNAATLSGRVRGHIGFSQKANTPFKGLAADGNKLALFRLLKAGYQVCGFIHDEMLVLIPKKSDLDASVDEVLLILNDAMKELCPDIPIRTEYLLADRWYKDVDAQPIDSRGQIVAYHRQQDS